MRRVRMTIDPHGVSLSRVHDLIAGGAEYLSEVSIVNWNVAALPEGVLLHVTGDYRQFEAELGHRFPAMGSVEDGKPVGRSHGTASVVPFDFR